MGRIYGAIFLVFIAAFAAGRCHAEGWRGYAAMQEIRYNLEAGLLTDICGVESHWTHPTKRGRHGEHGICQMKVDTVKMFCPTCDSSAEHLYRGLKSDKVKILQRELEKKTYHVGTIDGVFGLRTHNAVVEFQLEHGLLADGIVGPRTWKLLFGTDMRAGSLAEQLENPEHNIEYAARYLAWLKNYLKTDDRDILAAAYNGGPANPTVVYMLKVRNQ